MSHYSISAPDGEEVKTLPAETSVEGAKEELLEVSEAPGMMSGCYSLHLMEETDNEPPFGPGNPSMIGERVAVAEDGRLF